VSDVLKVGDNSPRVAEVRKSLARLGLLPNYNESGNPDHAIYNADTLFDDELEAALRGFQQARGIIASGEINEMTLRVLREASYELGARVLNYQPHNEMSGDDVVQLQQQLQELGFYSDPIDGHFPEKTNQHPRPKNQPAYQRQRNIGDNERSIG